MDAVLKILIFYYKVLLKKQHHYHDILRDFPFSGLLFGAFYIILHLSPNKNVIIITAEVNSSVAIGFLAHDDGSSHKIVFSVEAYFKS